MEHQDWNNISFNKKAEDTKKKESKKKQSQKIINPEMYEYKMVEPLGKILSKARAAKNLTQIELCRQLNIHQKILMAWENNKEIPTNLQISILEKKLGCKLPRSIKKYKDDST